MAVVDLAGPALSLGGLYAIPQSDWVAINQRVAVVIQDQLLTSEITKVIPNFAALVTVCSAWRAQTFPGLISDASETSLFAIQAQKVVSDLAASIAGLAPGAPLPDATQFILKVQIAALGDTAAEREPVVDALNVQVGQFATENKAADAAIQAVPGWDWDAIGGPVGNLESAMSDVQRAWAAIDLEFHAVGSGHTEVTTADLAASQLTAAAQAWGRLAGAAQAFDSMATNLT